MVYRPVKLGEFVSNHHVKLSVNTIRNRVATLHCATAQQSEQEVPLQHQCSKEPQLLLPFVTINFSDAPLFFMP